jgi:hypothetical protein
MRISNCYRYRRRKECFLGAARSILWWATDLKTWSMVFQLDDMNEYLTIRFDDSPFFVLVPFG